MLKKIPPIISPELMKILMEMGHGDQIVLADANFPAASISNKLIRYDGHGISGLLDAILEFFPLDFSAENSVSVMDFNEGEVKPDIWSEYRRIINKYEAMQDFQLVERFIFYEKARSAYAVVATGELALYANIILQKGVVVD